jgi:large subunit ribosomal protein L33
MVRELVALVCDACKRKNYTTSKNKKTKPEKLALRKFCPSCRTHTVHKESKI